jgi:hypothetical protein
MTNEETNSNVWLIVLLSACLSASGHAQTIKSISMPWIMGNSVTFRELKLSWNYVAQPPPTLRQVDAELSGALTGQHPNLSIEFVLLLKNHGPEDVKILDPLDFFSLQFVTSSGWPIKMPRRVPWFLPKVGRSRNAMPGVRPNAPYPEPVQFRQIVRIGVPSAQKEETITIPSATWIQIVFESEPVVMERVIEALRSETGEGAKQFKARAMMSLVTAPPREVVGRRLTESDWMFFSLSQPK